MLIGNAYKQNYIINESDKKFHVGISYTIINKGGWFASKARLSAYPLQRTIVFEADK